MKSLLALTTLGLLASATTDARLFGAAEEGKKSHQSHHPSFPTCVPQGRDGTGGWGPQAPANATPGEYGDFYLGCNNFTGLFTIRSSAGVGSTAIADSTTSTEGTKIHQKGFGFMNNLCEKPMTADTRFPIGSNTKFFTAVALYQLQEAGKVNLTDNIADYMTPHELVTQFGFPNGTTRYCPKVQAYSGGPGVGECQNITFVQILAMTSNIQTMSLFEGSTDYSGSWAYTLKLFMTLPLLAKPGSTYFYSNPSFILASFFIEKFSGLSFRRYIQTKITQPLGMTNTYLPINKGMLHQDPQRMQELNYYLNAKNTSHIISTGTCMQSEYSPGVISGAGGLISTQGDIAKLWFAVFNFTKVGAGEYPFLGGGILTAESVFSIVRARVLAFKSAHAYYAQGLGVIFSNTSGPNPITHPDAQPIPNSIEYEGGMFCVLSSNLLNLDAKPNPVLMQAWLSVNVFYPTEDEFEEASLGGGPEADSYQPWSWVERVYQWPQTYDPANLLTAVMAYMTNSQ